MKPWVKEIPFAAPLRDVRLAGPSGPSMQEVEQLRKQAEEAAYERGKRDGERALSEQLIRQRNELLELHNGVIESLRQSIPKVIRDTEEALIALSLEIAQKIVSHVPISAELVEACVREALSQVDANSELQILLNPDDLSLLKEVNSPVLNPAGSKPVRFQGSTDIRRGGCLVETQFGAVDGRRETKIELLKEALVP